MSNEENAPAVSVLVPIYNVERYLRECLDSLRAQTFEDFEVLCINDGSTDSSEGIVREFVKSDRRFRLISKENSGYGASMNRGLDEAKGECIAILESDDFMEPRALEVLHKAVSEGDADFAKANFSLYWTHPSPRNEFFEIVTPELDGCVVNPRDVPALFHAKSSIWSGMYRASFLKGNAIRFLETPGASYQDTGFNFKVWAAAQRVACVGEAVLHYRQDNEASSVNSPGKAGCVFVEYDEIERFMCGLPDGGSSLRAIELSTMYNDCMWNYERLAPQLRVGFLRAMAARFAPLVESGEFPFEELEPWKRADLNAILESPEAFNKRRWRFGEGRRGKAMHYLFTCGPAMALRIAKYKRGA